MDKKTIYYPESAFGGFTDIDGTVVFYNRVNSLITAKSVILDIGCGRGCYTEDDVQIRRDLRILRGKGKKVIGIDVDDGAASNPYVDEFHLLQGRQWPMEDDSVDLCLCDCVLEHVENPGIFFSEARRVIRSGGCICIRTPNIFGYVGLLAKLIPNSLHMAVLRKAQKGRKDLDVFPAFYNCNSISLLRKTLNKFGFECAVYGYESEPGYLRFSDFAYHLGAWYQHFAPGFIRNEIFAFGRIKKA